MPSIQSRMFHTPIGFTSTSRLSSSRPSVGRGGMSRKAGVKVYGLDVLKKNLDKLMTLGSSEGVAEGVLEVAHQIKDDMKAMAPRGATGATRRSIQAKSFKRPVFVSKAQTKKKIHAFVAVNYRISQGAHNAEFGTYDIRRPTKAKALYIEEYGIFVKSAAPMKATPFFRPTVEAWKGSKYLIAMTNAIERGLGKMESKLKTAGSRGFSRGSSGVLTR